MAHLVSFTTAKFDLSSETPNPINPIAGQSVLTWLRKVLLDADYECTEPEPEDWGWYMDVRDPTADYVVGASADIEDAEAEVEWILQLHKSRSMKEKLLGRNRMTDGDSLSAFVEKTVRADAAIKGVSVDRDG